MSPPFFGAVIVIDESWRTYTMELTFKKPDATAIESNDGWAIIATMNHTIKVCDHVARVMVVDYPLFH